MKCKKCDELNDTPILFQLLQETFKMDAPKVKSVYHKKGHKIFE